MKDGNHGRRRAIWPMLAAMTALAACGGSDESASPPAVTSESEGAAGQSAAASAPANEAPEQRSAPESTASSSLATDDVAYLSRLGLIRGHLRVGMQLYRDGRIMHAQSHMKHPGDELYAALENAFAARGATGFADELSALATAVESEAARSEAEAAYESLLAAISEAESHVEESVSSDAAAQGAIVVSLLETAAEEYGIGVSADGEVTDVHEYQDAYGFTLTAGDRAGAAESRVVSRSDHELFQTIVEEIDSMSQFWPELVPSGSISVEPAALEQTVARIRAEVDRL